MNLINTIYNFLIVEYQHMKLILIHGNKKVFIAPSTKHSIIFSK